MVRVAFIRGVVATLALTLTLVLAPAAFAGAVVGTFHDEHPVTDPTSLPECMPAGLADMVGTQDGTETTDGRFAANATGFHIEGSELFTYRVDFPDGRYVIGSAVAHFRTSFTASGQTVSGDIVLEPRTIYAADGTVIGRVLIHALSHITYRDLDGSGTPDPGEIKVELSRFSFTCG
jgi:hypothetical protein